MNLHLVTGDHDVPLYKSFEDPEFCLTFDEILEKVLNIFPNAELGEDNEGQIVIYTSMYPDKDSL